MTAFRYLSLFGAAALLTLTATAALATEPAEGARLGTNSGEISAALAQNGWDMTRFEREDGRIELTAIKEGRRIEAYIDPVSGQVARLEERSRSGPWPLPGADDAEIRARLEAEGYEIVKYEREHGRVEVYALRDGGRWELKIDPRDGRVVELEEDD